MLADWVKTLNCQNQLNVLFIAYVKWKFENRVIIKYLAKQYKIQKHTKFNF